MTGKVVTFYSYKGGVGRSFAVANIAVILAQWGYRVLAVDWDIEAPGLHHYFSSLAPALTPGVLDFISDCESGSPKTWNHYVAELQVPESRGRLFLMPASSADADDYRRRIQSLDW